jgi:hypothetical protein
MAIALKYNKKPQSPFETIGPNFGEGGMGGFGGHSADTIGPKPQTNPDPLNFDMLGGESGTPGMSSDTSVGGRAALDAQLNTNFSPVNNAFGLMGLMAPGVIAGPLLALLREAMKINNRATLDEAVSGTPTSVDTAMGLDASLDADLGLMGNQPGPVASPPPAIDVPMAPPPDPADVGMGMGQGTGPAAAGLGTGLNVGDVSGPTAPGGPPGSPNDPNAPNTAAGTISAGGAAPSGGGPSDGGNASGPGGSAGAPSGAGDSGTPDGFHAGGRVPGQGDQFARLQGGEYVVPRGPAADAMTAMDPRYSQLLQRSSIRNYIDPRQAALDPSSAIPMLLGMLQSMQQGQPGVGRAAMGDPTPGPATERQEPEEPGAKAESGMKRLRRMLETFA